MSNTLVHFDFRKFILSFLAIGLVTFSPVPASLAATGKEGANEQTPVIHTKQRVIIMVWDGLRPDSVSEQDTPNLFALKRMGVNFADNHSTYPTFTMMNASSLAAGSTPRKSGFFGNTFWTPPPSPSGLNAAGQPQNYQNPVFTEDYAILKTLNKHYDDDLIMVQTLFKTAHKAGLVTATVGKSGPAFLQDMGGGGYFLDENAAYPLSFAKELQAAHFPLPINSPKAFTPGELSLEADNASPTKRDSYITFAVPTYGETVYSRDASDKTQGAPEDAANKYMMRVFTQFILPVKKPDLSLIWFRTPDNNEHGYGVGSANYHLALKSQDARLGELREALAKQNLADSTNIIVVSDHGHSTVSGPTALFPLRTITPATEIKAGISNAQIGAIDPLHGYSFSGDVRSADLLTYAGFKAFDGMGCAVSAMAGIMGDGKTVYKALEDVSGELCGSPNSKYMAVSATLANPVASFKVPKELPPHAIVIAANGGSDYFYVPDHDPSTVIELTRFLQSREEYGAIFVDSRYNEVPGTFALEMVNLENTLRRDHGQPDVVASFNWDELQSVQGMQGIEFESFSGQRGMHGSFSPMDVHNTLLATGPAFIGGKTVSTPSGNVDVAPTVAYILGQSLPEAEGRILNESLVKPSSREGFTVKKNILTPAKVASDLKFKSPTDPSGQTPYSKHPRGIYSINLVVKDLTVAGKTYRYLDYAKALRN
jgi:predicted AlkP superfamily pyrophosphatase or phosphodiesterase